MIEVISWCARRDSNPHDFTHCHLKAARLPIPPRALCRIRRALRRTGSTARDVTNRGWRDKACQGGGFGLAGARQPRQHLLAFDREPVAIDQPDAAGDRQVIGENLDLVGLGGIQLDDGAATQAHDLMNRHRSGPEDHHEIDGDFIEGWHWGPGLTYAKLRGLRSPRYG